MSIRLNKASRLLPPAAPFLIIICSLNVLSAARAEILVLDNHQTKEINHDYHDNDDYVIDGQSKLLMLNQGTIRNIGLKSSYLSLESGSRVHGHIYISDSSVTDLGLNSAMNVAVNDGMTINTGSFAHLKAVIISTKKATALGIYDTGTVVSMASDTLIDSVKDDFSTGVIIGKGAQFNALGGNIISSGQGISTTANDGHFDASTVSLDGTSVKAGIYGVTGLGGSRYILKNSRIISDGKFKNINDLYSGKTAGIYMGSLPGNENYISLLHSLVEGNGERGTGVLITAEGGSTSLYAEASNLYGTQNGIDLTRDPRFSSPAHNTGLQSLTLTMGTQVIGKSGAAIRVESGNVANILLQDGAELQGGNGVAIDNGTGAQARVTASRTTIFGDIINHDGDIRLLLGKSSRWSGRFQKLSALSVSQGSEWDMTGSSAVGNLDNGGKVNLGEHATVGHTLVMAGNYTGHNGNLVFNTVLGGDSSLSDKVIVNGDTAGTTYVQVRNAGGHGAKTLQGIELIEVNGKSAGNFSQAGRIVAGAYDYSLSRGQGENNNNWYLNSKLTNPDGPVIHRIRPENGAYTASMAALPMFLTTLHERAGENRYMNIADEGVAGSLWLRQTGKHSQFHDGTGQLHTNANTWLTQLGSDIMQWNGPSGDQWHLGMMGGYGNNHNRTQSKASGTHASGTVDGYSAGAYATWYDSQSDSAGAYVDGQLLYNWFNNSVSGQGLPVEHYNASGPAASVETGYTFKIGSNADEGNTYQYFVEPQMQVSWLGIKVDDHREKNGTHVHFRGEDNILTRLGGRAYLRGHSQHDNGKDRDFEPFVEMNWLHGMKRYGVELDGVNASQAGGTNAGEVKLGVEGKLTVKTQLWGNVAQKVGGNGYSMTSAMLGLKYVF